MGFRKNLLIATIFSFVIFSISANSTKTVRVGYYADGNFHRGFSDSERKSGYAYDYYQEVAKFTDWQYEYVYGSYDEIFEKLFEGKVDIVAGVTKTPERLSAMLFPDRKMGGHTYYIYAPKGMQLSKNISVLNGSRIGVKADSYMPEMLKDYAKKHGFKCEIVPYKTLEERIEAFNNGKIDFVLTVDNDQIEHFKPIFELGEWDYYFAVNKLRPDILTELNTALDKIYQYTPNFNQLLTDKYFKRVFVEEALSDAEKITLYEMKKLRFGYVTNSMPISANDKNGKIFGVAKNVAEALGDYLGIPIEPKSYKGSYELAAALKNGEIDAAFPVYNDAWIAEQEGYKQTSPVISHRVMLVYKGEYRSNLLDKIAVGRSTIGQQSYLQSYYPNSEVLYYDTREEYFDAVVSGEASCLIGNESILQRFMRENTQYRDLNIVYLPHTEEFGIAVKPDNPILLECINRAVGKIGQAEIINSLIGYAYIDKPFSLSEFVKTHAIAVVITMAILIFLLALYFYHYVKQVKRAKEKEQRKQTAIREAYIASTNANAAKSDFLANMSHDIRTPVNAIIGMTAIANANLGDKVRVDDCLKKISASSITLLGIINDILDMSKIESGKMGLRFTEFNLDDLMQSLYLITEPLAKPKNIKMNFSTVNVIHRDVISDGNRLQQVFLNIMANAVQFSKQNGQIDITVNEIPAANPKVGCYEFIFNDSGCGMSDEFQEKLFQPFMQEETSSRTKKGQGMGLGLAISKNIIQMMGGDIKVTSKKGKGSKFTVTIFMEWIERFPETTSEGEKAKLQGEETIDSYNLSEFEKTDFSGKRALLVEDNVLNAEITSEILRMAKLEVEIAPDGKEAIDKILSMPDEYYDIVFMDVQMPIMNGYETTAAIRSFDGAYTKELPIIAMTANAFADDIAHAKQSGMNEHIAKPLKFDILLTTLNRWLGKGRKQAQKELDLADDFDELDMLRDAAGIK